MERLVIDGLSLGVLGIGSGWAIVALGVVMVFRGDLITRREARAMERHQEAAVGREAIKDQTIAEFTEAIETCNALIRSLVVVAEERTP